MKIIIFIVIALIGAYEAKGFHMKRGGGDREKDIQDAIKSVQEGFGQDREAEIRECMGKEDNCESVGCFYYIVAELTDDEEYHQMVVEWALGLRKMCWTDICETCGWCEDEDRRRSNKKDAFSDAVQDIQKNFGVDKEEEVRACLAKPSCESVACFYMLAKELTDKEDYHFKVGSWALKVNKLCMEDVCEECGWCKEERRRSFPSVKKSPAKQISSLSLSAKKRFLSHLDF